MFHTEGYCWIYIEQGTQVLYYITSYNLSEMENQTHLTTADSLNSRVFLNLTFLLKANNVFQPPIFKQVHLKVLSETNYLGADVTSCITTSGESLCC